MNQMIDCERFKQVMQQIKTNSLEVKAELEKTRISKNLAGARILRERLALLDDAVSDAIFIFDEWGRFGSFITNIVARIERKQKNKRELTINELKVLYGGLDDEYERYFEEEYPDFDFNIHPGSEPQSFNPTPSYYGKKRDAILRQRDSECDWARIEAAETEKL